MKNVTFEDVAQMLVESWLVYKHRRGYYNAMMESIDLTENIQKLTCLLRDFYENHTSES